MAGLAGWASRMHVRGHREVVCFVSGTPGGSVTFRTFQGGLFAIGPSNKVRVDARGVRHAIIARVLRIFASQQANSLWKIISVLDSSSGKASGYKS